METIKKSIPGCKISVATIKRWCIRLSLLGLCIDPGLVSAGGASNSDIRDFQASWVGKALEYQRKLQLDVPFVGANIIGTHNSYNSSAYDYAFPNQDTKINKQLNMGARIIDFDLHYYKTALESTKKIRLCHAQSVGVCSRFDRLFKDGLKEVRDWLRDNPNTVLIINLENHIDSQKGYSKARSILRDVLENYIYRSEGCSEFPSNITPRQILAAGKQVIVTMGRGCTGHDDLDKRIFHSLSTKLKKLSEDASTFGGGFDISESEIADGFSGENGPTYQLVKLDFMDVRPNKSRTRVDAGIWSWRSNRPNNRFDNDHCAHSDMSKDPDQWGGTWEDSPCDNVKRFACRVVGTKGPNATWVFPSASGRWDQGESVCNSVTGRNLAFGMPMNSVEQKRLRKAQQNDGNAARVWLNYTDQAYEGNWFVPPTTQFITVSLRSYHDKYVTVKDNGGDELTNTKTTAGEKETFIMFETDKETRDGCLQHDEKVALMTTDGFYFSAQSDDTMEANRAKLAGWETFTLGTTGGGSCVGDSSEIYLKTAHNKYVKAERKGAINAEATNRQNWELFVVETH